MMSMRVLVVEDEPILADLIAGQLRRQSMAVDVANDGQQAIDMSDEVQYDVVVLDRDLPVVHGDDVCRHIVASRSGARVLMLTAARRLQDKVDGFEIGADDYLAKPFEFPELIARLRAMQRRPANAAPPVLEFAGVVMDPFRHEVYRSGRYIALARKEFAVLDVLMRAKGGVVSSEQLLELAWDSAADPFTNAMRTTISSLRKRLGEPWIIHTVTGVGYRVGPVESGPNEAER